MNVKLTFTRDDSETLSIDGEAIGLTSLEGVDAPSVELFTEKRAVGDGDVVTGQRLASRLITLRARIRDPSFNAYYRSRLTRFFNPQHAFDVRINYLNNTRIARGCRLKALSMPTGNVYEPLALMASLLCPRPLLADAFTPLVYLTAGEPRTLPNLGDTDAWLRVTLRALGTQPVLNPALLVGGATVRVRASLAPGDQLTLDAERRVLTLNGANALHLLDPSSSLSDARLPMGGGELSLAADANVEGLQAQVSYFSEYFGI